METTATVHWKGPCAQRPQSWDMDAGTLTEWLTARRACLECPVLANCRELRDELYPSNHPRRPRKNPAAVILAGIAYSETGRVLDDEALRVYAARRAGHRTVRRTAEREAEAVRPLAS